jgi:type IV secretory pathway TrbD component
MTDSARDFRLDDPEADQLMAETPELLLYLPRLLAYPVRGYGLMVTITLGIALWIIGYAGVWGIPAAGIIFGWMGYYFMDVVQRSAVGHAIPPPMGSEVMFQGDKLRLAMLVGYLGAFVLLVLSAYHADQKGLGIFLFALGVYCLPAFLASLALQPDALSVLNPLLMLKFMWHTGLAYFFAATVLAVVGFLGIALSGRVSALSSDILLIYGLIFVCHMVGYVAYHHADQLDIAVQVEKPTDETRAESTQAMRVAEVMAEVDRHLEARETKAARDVLLSDDGAELANPRAFHEELFEALRLRHQDALSMVQAQRLIRLLLLQKRVARALEICEQCLDLDKAFLPDTPGAVGLLAEQALKDKHLKFFTALGAAVHARAPQGDDAVSLQFLKAQALVAQKQDGVALALLTPLQSRGNHPWAPRIQALYKALQAMQKKA